MTRTVLLPTALLAAVVNTWCARCGEDQDAVVIPRVTTPPTVDGKMDDPCWAKAAILTAFTIPGTETPPKKPVEARLCIHEKTLYLGVTCAEPEPTKLKAVVKLRDEQVWTDDCVEVWLRAGTEKFAFEQFIVNPIGTQEEARHREGKILRIAKPKWIAKTAVGEKSWTVEFAIPAGDLEVKEFRRGQMLGLKIGREDQVSKPFDQYLANWPPAAPYAGTQSFGRAYIEDINVVLSPDLQNRNAWDIHDENIKCFQSVSDAGAQVIRVDSPGRYCTISQDLALQPESFYALSAEIKTQLPMYVRVRARQADQKNNEPGKPFDISAKKSDAYVAYSTRFKTGPDGKAILILGVADGSGMGTAFVHNLRVSGSLPPSSFGPAIPLKADSDPLVVTKLPVSDCRALRGFIGAPVDGTTKSGCWDGSNWEYNEPEAGAGVGYAYHHSDGLHITLADSGGFQALQIRGGVRAKLYRDCPRYDDPAGGVLLYSLPGQTANSRVLFKAPVQTGRVSFFDVSDGYIADASFFRLQQGLQGLSAIREVFAADSAIRLDDALAHNLGERFGADERKVFELHSPPTQADADTARQFIASAGKAFHFISQPLKDELAIEAVGFDARITDCDEGAGFAFSVQDPLNGRLELHRADYVLDHAGQVRLVARFPRQVVPKGTQLWLTFKSEGPLALAQPRFEVFTVPREQALAEALEHRKFLLKAFYCVMSEARPWNGFNRQENLDKFLADTASPYHPWVCEILRTLDQCRALDPGGKDDIVRQYYQWIYRNILRNSPAGLPPYPTRLDQIAGIPEWAALAHQAWMQAREVPKWWIENRMTPNGELGGEVGDDTDMFGNYAPFPLFERDGVGGLVLDGAARLAQTADENNLEQGINRHTTDALHAYEEGMNHEALMSWWNYGDPVYLERCIAAARSLEALTVVTPKGHRHFRNYATQGIADLRMQRPLGLDGDTAPLMWHPALEAAWYNRSPKILKLLREWGDGWLEHEQAGQYVFTLDVATETPKEMGKTPFPGGWGLQGNIHMALAEVTREAKYIQPYLDFLAAGRDDSGVRGRIYELQQMGMLNVPREKFTESVSRNWAAQLYLDGNKKPLIEALKADVEELQRFRHMYTTVECFTDRVFLYAAINPCIAYTGGYVTRNKVNKNFAVSWDGFGTDYAALVTAATTDHLKVLLCNLSEKPLTGAATVWRLDHGRYALTLGPDANGDDQPDRVERQETLELARASRIALTLPPKTVQVLELKQLEKLDGILTRADLALSRLELRIADGKVSGKAHNIGAQDAEDVIVALVDPSGKVIKKKSLGRLAAPLDLMPKPVAFELSGVPENPKGWSVVLDPDARVPEIYRGNNRLSLGD